MLLLKCKILKNGLTVRLIWTIRFIHYVQYALKFSFTNSTEIFKTVFSLRSLRLYGPENFVNKNCQKLFCRFFLSKIKFVNICHHKNIIIIITPLFWILFWIIFWIIFWFIFCVITIYILCNIGCNYSLFIQKSVLGLCGTFGHLLVLVLKN